MSFIMGIDTGGTNTDGVIVDYLNKKILHKAKALTTKEDLTIGIENCLQKLCFTDYNKISLVSLSTTLATNAIVEGKGCKTGVIIIGDKPKGTLPTNQVVFLEGKFDIKGRVVKNLEEEQVIKAIKKFKGKVDSIAVSGYASIRNPKHELYVKNKIKEILDIPVACAHELTSSLGFYERTVTSILNASLIPIIEDLIYSVKTVLKRHNIHAPIMVVRGNGCLMHESVALEKPIETILSGPASSIIGGTFLTEQDDAIIVDMGGTTTDIASVQNGVVKIKSEGATVGGWLTRVKAAEIATFGIGGDSCICINLEGQLEIGPEKVWPLSIAAEKYPHLTEELKNYGTKEKYPLCTAQQTDCFMLVKKEISEDVEDIDFEIIKLLEKSPHSIFYLAHKLGKAPDKLGIQNLLDNGIIARISLTPTDILHAEGIYTKGNKEIAEIGVHIFANQLNLSGSEFLEKARESITNKLSTACLQAVFNFENPNISLMDDKAIHYFINKALNKGDFAELIDVNYSCKKPIVAIGAPVSAWLHKVANKLNTLLVIPEHSDVANAVGAAVGEVMETVEVLIRLDQATNRFMVHAPWSKECFDTLEDAVNYAVSHAEEYVVKIMKGAILHTHDINVIIDRDDIYCDSFLSNDPEMYVETRIKATATGNPILMVSFVE